jgi:hypothetical protein
MTTTFSEAIMQCKKDDYDEFKQAFKDNFLGVGDKIKILLEDMTPTQWMLLDLLVKATDTDKEFILKELHTQLKAK